MLGDIHKATFMGANLSEDSTNREKLVLEEEIEKFARLLNDAQCELYLGCKKYSKLSFLVKMLYNKAINNCINKSFSLNL